MGREYLVNLTQGEVKELQLLSASLVHTSAYKTFNLLKEKTDVDRLINYKVILILSQMSGVPTSRINDNKVLKIDLGLYTYHLKALKIYFQEIIFSLGSAKKISVKECTGLILVKDCKKLIKSKL